MTQQVERDSESPELIRLRRENERLRTELTKAESARKDLRSEVDCMRRLLEATTDGVFLMNEAFLDCNQRACNIWKCSRNDIIGRSPADFAPKRQPNGELSHDMAQRKISAALQGKPQHFFWKDRASDGSLVDTEVHLQSIEVDGDHFVAATIRDITDSKRKETESRLLLEEMERILEKRNNELIHSRHVLQDERTYRVRVEQDLGNADRELNKVFETSSDGLVVVDADQNILKINQAYSMLSGYSQQDINNKKCYEVFTCKGCTGKSCQAATMLRYKSKVEYETECLNSRGEVTPCIVSTTALKDSSGRRIGMVQNYRNITAFKRWVNELRHSEELHRIILSSISDAVLITDDDGCLFFVSPSVSSVFGYSMEEVWWMDNIYKLLGDFYSKEQLKRAGEIRNIELQVKDSENQPRDLIVTVKQVSIRSGTVLISCRDITEKKNAERETLIRNQQLEQAAKMASLGILVSGVAHEINNPNNFIMLNIPLLSRIWKDSQEILDDHMQEHGDFMLGKLRYSQTRDKITELFDGVSEGSQRIKRIVADMKRYVREEAGNMNQKVYLNSVIKHALPLLNNQIKKTTDRFEVTYSHERPCLKGNFQKVEQVVINLVQNACEALPDKNRRLKLGTLRDEATDTAVIVVEDEGVGIDAENLDHLMDPFFTTKRSCGGTGLGLSICQRIVKEHGGELLIESEPGKGARATLSFPISRSSEQASRKEV